MSVVGQALPIWTFWAMSGLPPVATKLRTSRIGSFVPRADKVNNAVAKRLTGTWSKDIRMSSSTKTCPSRIRCI